MAWLKVPSLSPGVLVKCVRLMPSAPIAIVADTYSNLVNNIMPAVQNGWKIDDLIEGVHYVKYKASAAG